MPSEPAAEFLSRHCWPTFRSRRPRSRRGPVEPRHALDPAGRSHACRRACESEAAKDADAAQRDYLNALEAAAQARSRLIDARATRLWVRRYPGDDALSDTLYVSMVCGGLLVPMRETLGDGQQRSVATVLSALKRDAAVLATHGFTADQGDDEPNVREQAVWEQTDEGRKAINAENQRILDAHQPRNRHRAGWGD
jgi:hypothetical protein